MTKLLTQTPIVCCLIGSWLASCEPVYSWASRSSSGMIDTNQPLSANEKATMAQCSIVPNMLGRERGGEFLLDDPHTSLRFSPVHSMHVHEGVDDQIFNNPEVLPDLIEVEFFDCPNLNRLLRNLYANYPQIQSMSFHYSEPVRLDDLASLSLFDNLRILNFRCSFVDSKIPKFNAQKLTALTLASTNACETQSPLPEMPELRTLSLENARIDDSFLKKIKAPDLETLRLFAVEVEENGLSEISRFAKLKLLQLDSVEIPKSELQYLSKLQSLTHIELKDATVAGGNFSIESQLRKIDSDSGK